MRFEGGSQWTRALLPQRIMGTLHGPYPGSCGCLGVAVMGPAPKVAWASPRGMAVCLLSRPAFLTLCPVLAALSLNGHCFVQSSATNYGLFGEHVLHRGVSLSPQEPAASAASFCHPGRRPELCSPRPRGARSAPSCR